MESCGLLGHMLENFWIYRKLLVGLDEFAVRARNEFDWGCSTTIGSFKGQDHDAFYLHLALCNLILLRGHKIFVVSLVDPFFIDCVTFYEHPTTYSTAKFHDIRGIQGYLSRFYVYCL